MINQSLTLGPVLSFRGMSQDGRWQVTALVGVPEGEDAPAMHVEGRQCEAPRLLHRHGGEQYLRYDLSCGMQDRERKVEFGFAASLTWCFTVPALAQAPRMAYVSCNGFSDPAGMRKLVRPANAVWEDLISSHDRNLRAPHYLLDKEQLWHESRTHAAGVQRFHLLLMGGDQIYFDSIWEDVKALKQWVSLSRKEQLRFKVSPALEAEIAAYYFSLYGKRWLPASRHDWNTTRINHDAADAMARIPTVMMWDDHDIFDGWGSYSSEMQHCELFRILFRYARQAFWVFQMQHALEELPELQDNLSGRVTQRDPLHAPIAWQSVLGNDPLRLPVLDDQPGFTFAFHLGPISLLVADLRTERSRTQVLGPLTWGAMQDWLAGIGKARAANKEAACQHLLLLSSVPVVHPKLPLAEGLLDNFGQDHVTDSNADDLQDHWSHDDHEGERKRLLETLLQVAERHHLRASIVSGDVHVAAWGSAYRRDIPPTANWAQIHQFTSSAIVHPSLTGVLERLFMHFLNEAARKIQSIDIQHSVEMMLFPGYHRHVMPARNWLALELETGADGPDGCKLWATWRCETGEHFSNHLQAVQPARA